ncbi:MAG: glycoside hydrolase family 88 protein [Ignavibacteriales bacterium]|nr:glycoside hydrolase family 88 protein [Ignavibacteriales bacterium]MCB9218110.1 glycoside hydrolase family 88 protein [Ignavibacteriales bacterium]MCB9260499.1 glycoside hydrolase family 88 protein [Ignavibacteriales bacterium]
MKRRKFRYINIFVILFGLLLFSQTLAQTEELEYRKSTKTILKKIADRILSETSYQFIDTETGEKYKSTKGLKPKLTVKIESKYNDWHYTNGVLNFAMNELGNLLEEKKYNDFVDNNFDFVFNHGDLDYFKKLYDEQKKIDWFSVRQVTWHMFYRMIRLDDCGTIGASLIDVYKKNPQENYKNYIDLVSNHILKTEPRLEDGTISRYWPHENTIWADDLFMSVAFLARMGKFTGESKYFDDAINQVKLFHKYLWNNEKEIFYHCYHTDTEQNGVAHWARANGWMFMAEADLLDVLPENYPERDKVLEIFQDQAEGIARWQSENGLWHQLLDKNDSYLETSASAMFVFGLAKGVNRGWINQDYSYVADTGWEGVLSNIDDNGNVHKICVGTGIMPALSFYYKRPVESNIPMGEGPVIRAGVEIIKMKKYHELPARAKYDRIINEAKEKK